eukprot:m.536138 g.536138  ORF g.536138 m.536138 type:complete len:210 (+) comp22067_c0_seq19:643-1272(+)
MHVPGVRCTWDDLWGQIANTSAQMRNLLSPTVQVVRACPDVTRRETTLPSPQIERAEVCPWPFRTPCSPGSTHRTRAQHRCVSPPVPALHRVNHACNPFQRHATTVIHHCCLRMHRRARQAYHMPTTSECTQENSLPTQAVMQGHIVLQRTSGAIQYGDPTTDCAARFSNEDFNVSEFLRIFESPKSDSFACPAIVSKIFAALMSPTRK